jgi:putative ABC transport system permease protein
MILWRFTAREIRNRPGRALLTLGSIVIGVSAVVAVTVATSTSRSAYQEMYESLAGRTGLEVVTEAEGLSSETTLPALEKIPGVKAVVPSVQRPTILYHKGARLKLLAMGIDPQRERSVRDYVLREGQFLDQAQGAVLEAGFARGLGVRVNDKVRLLANSPGSRGVRLREVTVIGLLELRGVAGFKQGGVILLPLEDAERWFLRPGQVNNVGLVLDPEADVQKVSREVQALVPPGTIVRAPAARTNLASETMVSIDYGLKFAYALSVVLAVLMILNTFLMNVKERRRQLAVLRAVGATRGQIMSMLLREGLVLGVAGTVIGFALGLGGASVLTQVIGQIYGTPLPAVRLTPWSVVVAGVLGPAMALFATYIPARSAAKVSPLEAMRPAIATNGRHGISRSYVVVALSVYGLTGAGLGGTIIGWLPGPWAIYLGVAFMASVVLLVPLVVGPLVRLTALVFRPLLGVEGLLACRQMLRRRARTSLTLSVLFLAISTGIGLGTTINNNVEDVRSWFRRTVIGDFFVRAMFPDPETGTATDIPAELEQQIAAIPGVRGVASVRYVPAQAGDQAVVIFVRQFPKDAALPTHLVAGDPAQVDARMAQGEVLVGTVVAKRLGLGVGDELKLTTNAGPRTVRIAGLTTEYMAGGLVVQMERAVALKLFKVGGVDCFLVKAEPQARAEVEVALRRFTEERGLMLNSFADLSEKLEATMAGVVGSLWGLLALGFIVAGFGIANTLTMNVLEQTRELALLRVVAMTRRQVAKTILAQAGVLGVIGIITGIITGVTTAFSISLTTMPMLGYRIDFSLSPSLLTGCFVFSLVVVLVAAWLPAQRAAGLNLLEALKYE